ncbi:MAG: sigma 54-interacting transcriptional regulator [Planctomycetota bacterium]|nr:sigma 54-interacting transcriptional regulator [Planctomycetota bacterium]
MKRKTMPDQKPLSFSEIYRSGLVSFDMILGVSKAMLDTISQAKSAALSDAPVLLVGETGTGKNILAQAIHNAGGRSKRPFCEVNCGGLHEMLQESELFGHTRGAFTGADKDRDGLLMLAQGGTLFLNEVGDIPASTQKKLIDVIEYKKFRKLGQDIESTTNIRAIAGTNRDLDSLRAKGEFRDDFYYRLNCFRIEVPALRKRKDDIPVLVDSLLREFSARESKNVSGVSPKAMSVLVDYDWPGNVRQLRFVIWRTVATVDSEMIEEEHVVETLELSDAKSPNTPLASLEEVERNYITKVLCLTNWNKTRAAEILRISRVGLNRRIHALRISEPA